MATAWPKKAWPLLDHEDPVPVAPYGGVSVCWGVGAKTVSKATAVPHHVVSSSRRKRIYVFYYRPCIRCTLYSGPCTLYAIPWLYVVRCMCMLYVMLSVHTVRCSCWLIVYRSFFCFFDFGPMVLDTLDLLGFRASSHFNVYFLIFSWSLRKTSYYLTSYN